MADAEGKVLTGTAVVLGLCGIALTALLIRREVNPRAGGPRIADRAIQGWQSLAAVGNAVGSNNPKHTLVVFTDYQCPACRNFESVVGRLLTTFPSLRVVYRHFPLMAIHPAADEAANAAESAANLGAFASLHSVLFERQSELGSISWSDLGAQAGIGNLSKFDDCVKESGFAARVRADLRTADSLGLHATPSVILDGLLFALPPTVDAVTRLLAETTTTEATVR